LAVNSGYHYPPAIATMPVGPDPKRAFSQGFFYIAMSLAPKPQTLAILGADPGFARNATDRARVNAKATSGPMPGQSSAT
jgi:branched-chain amino acid transport system substrate-binding protein